MWSWLTAIAVIALMASAVAQPRPNTMVMSCRDAQALIVSRGAVVLGTGPHTYDRYVRDQGYCPAATIGEQSWERTADVAACPIGLRCRDAGESTERSGDR